MQAAIYTGKQQLSVEDIPTPVPGEGEVLVQVNLCAICGTDVHGWLYDIVPVGTVLGHEFSGVIAVVGPGVTQWKEGDRVMGGGGTAPPGQESTSWTDPQFNFRATGFHGRPLRAYAEYAVLSEWEPLAIPDGVSDEEAALCEPCSVGVRAVRLSQLSLGDTVAVLGAGPIGMMTLQAARAAGAGSVYVSEPAVARRVTARSLGADAVVDSSSQNVVARMLELTEGGGPHIVFDCAGVGTTLDQAFNMVTREGQVVLVALGWEPTPVTSVDWMGKEVRLQTAFGGRPEDWLIALDLMSTKKVSVEPMLTETDFIPLSGIQQAFEALKTPSTELQMVVKF